MRNRRGGFTLVELLVVITIIILVSAVALPTVIPALTSRQVSEAARILQAAIAGARDSAIRANAPRGIRLLPDATLSPDSSAALAPGQTLASNRIVPIEPAPDLTDSSTHGSATYHSGNAVWDSTRNGNNATSTGGLPPIFPFPPGMAATARGFYPYALPVASPPSNAVLMVVQAVWKDNAGLINNPPTNWFWNVRIGDKFRATDSGRYYTVVGPMTIPNPENFVNDGTSDISPYNSTPASMPSLIDAYPNIVNPASPIMVHPEFLFLVNGLDDNGNGLTDEGVDGLDNDLNGFTDDISEWVTTSGFVVEQEQWVGSQALNALRAETGAVNPPPTFEWTITRRPVPSPGAREVSLPGGAVIDLTTWDFGNNERSRAPVDPFSHNVDILMNQAGQIVPTTLYSTPASASMGQGFYHFWISDRLDVASAAGSILNPYPTLPVGSDVAGTKPPTAPGVFLKRDRILVTLFARTGQVVSNSIEGVFDYGNANAPYQAAQLGIREAK